MYRKTGHFAQHLGADIPLSQAAALTHDLNHVAHKGVWTESKEGALLRKQMLTDCKIQDDLIQRIEAIIQSCEIVHRGTNLSLEGQALSDADSLFKVLPSTPILFTAGMMKQTDWSIKRIAEKVVRDQLKLIESDTYFFSDYARQNYMHLARANIYQMRDLLETLNDDDIAHMLRTAGYDVE